MEGTLEERVAYLEAGMEAIVRSCALLLVKLTEVADHTNEHHNVINDLGRIVATLEEMMIGGTDETPDPPAVP